MIINRIARISNKIKCCPNTMLAIHEINSIAIRINMVILNNMSNLCLWVMAAMKYVIIMIAAITIINISNTFILSPQSYMFPKPH